MPERLIATYGRRRGRTLRAERRGLIETLLPKLEVQIGRNAEMQQSPSAFLEIGFGSGEHLAARAVAAPEALFIGCEPYLDGVGTLLKAIDAQGLKNIRIHSGDARELIGALPEECLCGVYILFPDPWPKSRHHKRRLVQLPFLEQLARVMKPGAELQLATDHADYLTWMLSHLLACPHFEWAARSQADWTTPPSGWVRTKYQRKAEREGRGATFLRFTRKA